MEIKTVSVIGLGALGVLFSDFLLEKIPHENLRIVADKERIERYKRDGVYCNGKLCDFNYIDCDDENIQPADLVIFATKYGALESAVKTAKNQIGDNTTIISLLNGIISEEMLEKHFGSENVLLCTAQGMDAVKPKNKLTYSHFGSLSVGTRDSSKTERLDAVDRFLAKVNMPYNLPQNMLQQLWGKLMLNVGVNQAVTVYETNYGGVQTDGAARKDMIAAMYEVVSIGSAENVLLTPSDVDKWVALVDTLSPEGKPSMRQDAEAKRKSEVELFSGTITRLGDKHSIDTPVNDYFYTTICDWESNY